MTQALNWGDTKGEADSGKVNYMTFNDGTNRIRIVGDILRRYVYWVKGAQGKSAPFENTDFNRDTERFESGGPNAVKELGLFETNFKTGAVVMVKKDGEEVPKPLGSKKSYLVPVINRATNQIEYMELKKGIFDGINEVMGKLNDPKQIRRFADPEYRVPNPMYIDVVFTKSGKGLDTEYKVDIIDTLDMVQDDDCFTEMKELHEKDAALLKDLKPTEEVFPRTTYAEQKENLAKWINGTDEKKNEEGKAEPNKSEEEAMNELDD